MTKKLFAHIMDTLFWWLMWVIPIVGGLIVLGCGSSHDYASFIAFLNNFSFTFVADILSGMFGIVSMQLPAFLLAFMSYVVSVELCHVLVDVLVFIPRFCHKLVQLETYVDIDKGGKR